MPAAAGQNPEASNWGRPLPNQPGMPWLLATSLNSLLSEAGAPLGSCPASPTCASEAPVWGPHHVSQTLTGIDPQIHTVLASAFSISWYFYFWNIILDSFVKSNHWSQCNAMECSFSVGQLSQCPLGSQQARLYPGALSWPPRCPCEPPSPATRTQNGFPGRSPLASVPGCRSHGWWPAAHCFRGAPPCVLAWSSTAQTPPWWRRRTWCRATKTRRRERLWTPGPHRPSLLLPFTYFALRVTFSSFFCKLPKEVVTPEPSHGYILVNAWALTASPSTAANWIPGSLGNGTFPFLW